MSSDNYYAIRIHPDGGFAAINASASDDRWPIAESRHPQFDQLDAAIAYGTTEYSEYGVNVHPECRIGTEGKYVSDNQLLVWSLEDQVTTLQNLIWEMWSDITDQTGFHFAFRHDEFSETSADVLEDTIGSQAWELPPWLASADDETRVSNNVEIDGKTYSVHLPSWGILSDDWQKLDRPEKPPLYFTPALLTTENDPRES